MPVNKNDFSIQMLKQLDLVHYLASLGYEPTKIRENDFWYFSPLRRERTPSFKINRALNRWYDFGLGQGGSLLDFALAHQGCSIGDLLRNFQQASPPVPICRQEAPSPQAPKGKVEILEQKSIRSEALLRYLQERRIAISIADQYCLELTYRIGQQTYLGLGFPNLSGGFEIRNRYSKICHSPKNISHISRNNTEVLLFEGFMDFLTFRTLNKQLDESSVDFMVLNSISLFHRAEEYLEPYTRVGLYLDQDDAGRKLTHKALAMDPKFIDESAPYAKYKDLNQWMTELGKHSLQNTHGKLQATTIRKSHEKT